MSSSTGKYDPNREPRAQTFTVYNHELLSILRGSVRIDWKKIGPDMVIEKVITHSSNTLTVFISDARLLGIPMEGGPYQHMGNLPTCPNVRPDETPPPSTLAGDPLTEAVNSCLTISRAALNVLQKLVGQEAARGR